MQTTQKVEKREPIYVPDGNFSEGDVFTDQALPAAVLHAPIQGSTNHSLDAASHLFVIITPPVI